ncbi:hypothetical protein [Brevundimonas sp. TWP2-3-4b2]|uniref:hypothetical protein n=1 Tax=Brevundimonas sp. TWP2-3-4b2 TaxID=2804595 RepID=UPI003CF1F3EC
MKGLAVAVFTVAFLGWAWLEFASDRPADGIKEILFWIGMGAVLVSGWEGRSRAPR